MFYLNLPIAGVALVLQLLFLQVNYDKETTFRQKVKRIDYVGNIILIASVVSMLLALSWGGTLYEWSAYQVLVPLIMGFVGLAAFHAYQTTSWCAEPTLPHHIFTNRTTATALILSFVHFMLLFWIVYFLPVYFQAVLGSSSARAGVQLLPTVLMSVPIGIVAGVIISKTGRYRPLHFVGFALMTIGDHKRAYQILWVTWRPWDRLECPNTVIVVIKRGQRYGKVSVSLHAIADFIGD